MTKRNRANGKLIRKIVRLDRKWRAEGKVEGRTENDLAMWLGVAARRGLYRASDRARKAAAAR